MSPPTVREPTTCVIVDDELHAQQLLERYVHRVTSLRLLATFNNAVDAYQQLPHLQPDLLLLDVQMPEMSGLEFLRVYPGQRPLTILTTAHADYALDAFELGVVDYLLKPVLFNRFLLAISRAQQGRQPAAPAQPASSDWPVSTPSPSPTDAPFIYLKSDKRIEQVQLRDILFIEGLDDYVKVHLPDRLIVTHLTLYKLEASLPAADFIRINRSYIVQSALICSLEGNLLTLTTGRQLPVGPRYREALLGIIDQRLIR